MPFDFVEPELSRIIVGAFFQVYNDLGYGLSESLYAKALEVELQEQGCAVEREHLFEVVYRGREIGRQRLDMLVDRRVIVEVKSTEHLAYAAHRQLRSYVCASGLRLGILLHFGPKPAFFREIGPRQRR